MSPSTPYLFVEIWVPKRPLYNHERYGWPTIVGDFVRPLVTTYPDLLVWFLREGRHWQLCFAHPGGQAALAGANQTMRAIAKRRGFHIKRYIRGSTLGGALGGTRWTSKAERGTPVEAFRSLLLCYACHSICALYLSSLARYKGHWEVVSPECQRQNPHGSLFESFMHLVANVTGARFDVHLQVKTRWMHEGWQDAKVVCHL